MSSIVETMPTGVSDGANGISGYLSQFQNQDLYSYASFWNIFWTLLAAAVIYEQIRYQIKKGVLPGPRISIPFMGAFLESIYPDFDKYYAKWMSGSLSCVSVFHKFVVIASSRDLARKALNAPQYAKPCVVDIARKLLRPNNWVFLDGRAHVDYRKGLNGLFTIQNLSIYLKGQEVLYDRYLKRWVEETKRLGGQPKPFMHEFREINCAISCRTFVGDYISEEAVQVISDNFYKITAALDLVNFPIIIPFTRTWYGKKAADLVLYEFQRCAQKSKDKMAAGGEITCVADAWVKSMMASAKHDEDVKNGVVFPPDYRKPQQIRDFSTWEMSMTLFTFLFASQDATASATTWLFQVLAQRPEVLNRIRQEQLDVRHGDHLMPLSLELLEQMKYTNAAVKELLRYRPPVIMVPYEVKKAYQITPDYIVPKGAMLVPTLYPALHDPEVYPNPDSYDPDRWITGTAGSEEARKNWLVFGTGPHVCLGQTYAIHHLMAMIGKASMMLEWEHFPTPKSEEIKVFATIFPMDDCALTFKESALGLKRQVVAA